MSDDSQAMSANIPEPAGGSRPSEVAIIGMSALFPGAVDVEAFWANTLRGTDAIVEVPSDRWDWRLYYDKDPKAPDKVISKWGGFVPDIPFDPLQYGMPPATLSSIESVQLLTLEIVRAAIEDAGYSTKPFARERTAVVLGMGGGAAQMAMGYAFRSYLPMLDLVEPGQGTAAMQACKGLLPEWTEDSFPGFLLNVAAGRVSNRFDLGGANYTVDAACGSSLAAANLAVRELEVGAADVVILVGADTVQNPFTYLAFSKTQAFSPRGRCRPFDASADGIVISEGVAAVILKRRADAERDGDRIYALIQGIGSSSDGRSRGLTAPNPEGQHRALRRAYAKAGISPKSVGYVEAHGTGTAVGDVVEVGSLTEVFKEAGSDPKTCALGSVKSQIGHTKCAAGMAGLINATLALHHKVLPPTIGVENPNPKVGFSESPFHVSIQERPWIHTDSTEPRRAGVSAFGFGGTNFHAVLEEYPQTKASELHRAAELFLWRGDNSKSIVSQLEGLKASLNRGAIPKLRDLAHSLSVEPPKTATLGIVASSHEDLRSKLEQSISRLNRGERSIDDPRGIVYESTPRFLDAKVAFVFPGQGSQRTDMLLDLAMAFGSVRASFDAFDQALRSTNHQPVGTKIFAPSAWTEAEKRSRSELLRPTEIAQPALGSASVAVLQLLGDLGVRADMFAGHSYGELVALYAAGSLSIEGLADLSATRGKLVAEAVAENPGTMIAVQATIDETRETIASHEHVHVANHNGPRQTVLAGTEEAIQKVVAKFTTRGIRTHRLAVSGPFHTEGIRSACEPLSAKASELLWSSPIKPVYSNLTAEPHDSDIDGIAKLLGEHVAQPVEFVKMIEAMHQDGAQVFVEVGPGGILTSLIGSILQDKPHLATSTDRDGKPGFETFLIGVARLVASGVRIDPTRLTMNRESKLLDLANLPVGDGSPAPSPSTWLVNGSRARPINGPEPERLGQHKPERIIHEPKHVQKPTHSGVNGKHGTGTHTPMNTQPDVVGTNGFHVAETTIPERSEAVLLSFQETMRTFLDVQRTTMIAYLGARPPHAAVPSAAQRPNRISATTQPHTNGSAKGKHAAKPHEPQKIVTPVVKPVEPKSPPATTDSISSRFGREQIIERLIGIVQDRTGYPAEMLELNLDLEADLGIDSIKRVDILGTLRDMIPELEAVSTNEGVMEALSRARTLGAIVDKVEESAGKLAPRLIETSVVRSLLEAVEIAAVSTAFNITPGSTVVITEDEFGVAHRLSRRLESDGYRVHILNRSDVSWTSPASVEAAVESVRQSGPISGLIHLASLRQGVEISQLDASFIDRTNHDVRGLFLLAKAIALDLEAGAQSEGACLIAATSSLFSLRNRAQLDSTANPEQGGISGLIKTLAREWPDVLAKTIDFDHSATADFIADQVYQEIGINDGWFEIGYPNGRRSGLRAVVKPLGPGTKQLELKPGEPVVITGGARGISAAIASELYDRFKPALLLVGASPIPEAEDDLELIRLTGENELKEALLKRMKRKTGTFSPADLERTFQSFRKAREIRSTLETLRRRGATVEYAHADVQNEQQLAQVLKAWRGAYGPPVGMIHAAGVIRDKLIRDKSVESFDHVLGPKVQGAVNITRLIDPNSLKFLAFFSSIAGRFGNVGQSDYAAANEILSHLALSLDRRWKCRVLSAIWGPWSEIGMVSNLEGHLGRQGLGMITPAFGPKAFVDELEFGIKGDVEVILSGSLGTLDQAKPVRSRVLMESVR